MCSRRLDRKSRLQQLEQRQPGKEVKYLYSNASEDKEVDEGEKGVSACHENIHIKCPAKASRETKAGPGSTRSAPPAAACLDAGGGWLRPMEGVWQSCLAGDASRWDCKGCKGCRDCKDCSQ